MGTKQMCPGYGKPLPPLPVSTKEITCPVCRTDCPVQRVKDRKGGMRAVVGPHVRAKQTG
jgi:hypothetical protein